MYFIKTILLRGIKDVTLKGHFGEKSVYSLYLMIRCSYLIYS
jgi:hypothetical protein